MTIFRFAAASALGAALLLGAIEDKGGTLSVVDGKTKTDLKLLECQILNTDDGHPDGFEINGDDVFLAGFFDLNGDGKQDGKDKFPTKDNEDDFTSIVNKTGTLTPTTEKKNVGFILGPDKFDHPVLKGSITVKKYKPAPGSEEHSWEGTFQATVKDKVGKTKTLEGTFKGGVKPVY